MTFTIFSYLQVFIRRRNSIAVQQFANADKCVQAKNFQRFKFLTLTLFTKYYYSFTTAAEKQFSKWPSCGGLVEEEGEVEVEQFNKNIKKEDINTGFFTSASQYHHHNQQQNLWRPQPFTTTIEKIKSFELENLNRKKVHLKMFHWVNIYRNTNNVRYYCADLQNLTERNAVVRWRSRVIFCALLLETVHYYYLFRRRDLSDVERLLHFDYTLLLRTIPSVNCLSSGMFFLNLIAFYLLFWFDFKGPLVGDSGDDKKKLNRAKKMLSPAYLVSQVYCQKNTTSFIFRRDSKKGVSIINIIDRRMKVFSYLIDVYVSVTICK